MSFKVRVVFCKVIDLLPIIPVHNSVFNAFVRLNCLYGFGRLEGLENFFRLDDYPRWNGFGYLHLRCLHGFGYLHLCCLDGFVRLDDLAHLNCVNDFVQLADLLHLNCVNECVRLDGEVHLSCLDGFDRFDDQALEYLDDFDCLEELVRLK